MNLILWVILTCVSYSPPTTGTTYYRNMEYKTYDGKMFNTTDSAVERNTLTFLPDSSVVWRCSYAYVRVNTFRYKETKRQDGYTVFCYIAGNGDLLLLEKSLEMAYIFTEINKQNYKNLIILK